MYVYILISEKDGTFYIGSTGNIKERLIHHNKGYNLSTRSKRPWLLARTEKYASISLALKREKFLKSGRGRKVVRNLCRHGAN